MLKMFLNLILTKKDRASQTDINTANIEADRFSFKQSFAQSRLVVGDIRASPLKIKNCED